MKSFFNIIMVVLCLFGLTINNAFTQTENTTVETEKVIIIMKNGEEFKGEVVFEDDKEITLISQNGKVVLDVAQIKKIEQDDYSGKFDFENSNKTRYFFTASAIPLKKGKGYYQNIYGVINSVNVGLTENLSIGGGLELMTTFSGNAIWFITPKIGFEVTDKIHIGAGGIVAGFGLQDHISMVYGVGTFGDSDFNVTTGVGIGFYDGKRYVNPAFNISSIYRITNQLSIMTENYLLPNEFYLGIHGLRWMANKNAVDFGAMTLGEPSAWNVVLPYIGYTRSF